MTASLCAGRYGCTGGGSTASAIPESGCWVRVQDRWPPVSRAPATTGLAAGSQPMPASPTQWMAEKFIEGRKAATEFFTSAAFARNAGGLAGGVGTSTFGLIGKAVVGFGVGLGLPEGQLPAALLDL